MFQNILKDFDDSQNENYTKEKNKLNLNRNIYLYIISFLLSMVGIGTELAPFGIAILVATLSNNIPIGIMCITVGLGTLIGFGLNTLLQYILISMVFFVLVAVKKPKIQTDTNEKNKLGTHLFFSCFIVGIIQTLFKEIYIYEIIYNIIFAMAVTVFYKIFVNAITVIKDYKYKKVFSIEEVVGATLLIAIAIAGVGDIAIFGFSLKNILSILLVLILGWKNGILVGATTGITVGIVLGIIASEGPIMVAAYSLSGMMAGLFRKFGKIGVAVGFVAGTIVLTYVENGITMPVILFKEILIAFIGLLAVPNNIEINIGDSYNKTKCLPISTDRGLEGNTSETIYKLGNMSDTISEMAKSYKEAAATIVDEEELLLQQEKNKKIFIEELMNGLDGLEDNILFDDLYGSDTSIVDSIFTLLLEKEQIKREDLITIFEDNNNYLIGFDTDTKDNEIGKDIEEVIKVINTAFRLSKINFIWKKKLDENKRVVSNQLEEVSKAINTMATDIGKKETKNEDLQRQIKLLLEQKNIELKQISIKKSENDKYIITLYTKCCENVENSGCNLKTIQKIIEKSIGQKMILQKQVCGTRRKIDSCMYLFTSTDKYNLQIGIARATKVGSAISGDTTANMKLEDGKHLVALSDGMGSGQDAKKSSSLAISMLEKMLSSGFEKDTSIKLINSILSINTSEEMYTTLDVGIIDLFNGTLEFIKNGACPTYVKNGNKVELLKSVALPTGIIADIDLVVYEKDIQDGDIIVMCTDGILESNDDYTNKELWVQYLLEEIKSDDAQKVADIILGEAIDNDYGIGKDDMTVIVAKVNKI
ncbi:MAG: SpoIIE family protein phosphatase [Clostridia bacterium]|nr:SpoIIE family protein phosphatase [Clostridia bacterium]